MSTAHDLYKTGDRDAPDAIKDRNGEVVLTMCRRCGEAEATLGRWCEAPLTMRKITGYIVRGDVLHVYEDPADMRAAMRDGKWDKIEWVDFIKHHPASGGQTT